jgi:hypothetical protein
MNINTGQIYESYKAAIAAGEDERDLVTATSRETLEELRRRLNLNSRHTPHQGARERARRVRQAAKRAAK